MFAVIKAPNGIPTKSKAFKTLWSHFDCIFIKQSSAAIDGMSLNREACTSTLILWNLAMTAPQGSNENSVKSLQETCLDLAFEKMMQPAFNDADLHTMEPRLLRMLFSKLRAETLRTVSFKEAMTQNCPEADLQFWRHIHEKPSKTSPRCRHGFESECEKDERKDGEDGKGSKPAHLDWEFYGSDDDGESVSSGSSPTHELRSIADRISSPLLMYRLVHMFGHLPAGFKPGHGLTGVWGVSLVHHDDGSILCLGDCCGHARMCFYGTDAGSQHAERLMEHLMSVELAYDAGCGALEVEE